MFLVAVLSALCAASLPSSWGGGRVYQRRGDTSTGCSGRGTVMRSPCCFTRRSDETEREGDTTEKDERTKKKRGSAEAEDARRCVCVCVWRSTALERHTHKHKHTETRTFRNAPTKTQEGESESSHDRRHPTSRQGALNDRENIQKGSIHVAPARADGATRWQRNGTRFCPVPRRRREAAVAAPFDHQFFPVFFSSGCCYPSKSVWQSEDRK